MMSLQKAWFSERKWVYLLLPLSTLFYLLSALRRLAFRLGLLSSGKPAAKVIIVGNISVGGNGKTPTVIAIAKHLSSKGYSCGILSRGYGGDQTEFPYHVKSTDEPSLVGDEPALISRRLSCPVVIDPVRRRGADYLSTTLSCDVIICDDGLQHYALKRDFEIVVMDGRGIGNGFLLPAGPLRETQKRLKNVDVIVHNSELVPSCISQELKSKTVQMRLRATRWVNVKSGQISDNIREKSTLNQCSALAGIGDPKRFFSTLKALEIECSELLPFPDHHQFTNHDLPNNMVLMTEKDAVKIKPFAHDNCWYLEVEGDIEALFFEKIEQKLNSVQ
ncbi:MAG: tetraacyldisaccharide 4'-kinase [Glaciecola sp.]|jgi:tetraacyldisaccharide 4'-kinase